MSRQKWTGTNLESLMDLGKPAVSSLIKVLRNSRLDHVRWEAAKTLGAIGDTRAIPPLVKALEDSDTDVAWLAAEALRKFKKLAWPPLLRQRAHHVFRNQRE